LKYTFKKGRIKMVYQEDVSLQTQNRAQWVDVTAEVQRIVVDSAVRKGICVIASMHTTGGVTLNENADPDVQRDFFHKLNELVPQSPSFRHAEGNSDSHLKSSLVGLSVQVPVKEGKMALGTWQSVYFCEFDGPRSRRLTVTVLGE
jgi:secondary thiamine-phosphate synthase enzyme